MNKNNFMKAMSMIDEDLILDADTQYTGEKTSVSAEDLYIESESEMVVSGVDVYHRTAWKKILAVAASFVLVFGAVGGGAYYFSQVKGNNIGDDMQYVPIYSRLKSEKDNYTMNMTVCVNDGEVLDLPADTKEKEDFFEYMDQFDMITETEEISKTARHLKFNFGTEKDTCFVFDLYENGDCSWTDKSSGKTTYHRLADGKQIFDNFAELYNIEDHDPLNWNDVSEEEIEDFIEKCYDASLTDPDYPPDIAIIFSDNGSKIYKLKNRYEINKIILSCEWERTEGFNYDTRYCQFAGIYLSEDGCLTGEYQDWNFKYKVKDSSYLDKLSAIWQTYMESTEPHDINEAWQLISNETAIQWEEGPLYVGQGGMDYDNINYYYHFSDPRSFADEIMSLEWDKCDESEWNTKVEYQNDRLYISDGYYMLMNYSYSTVLSLSPRGYMNINHLGCYKLKNEDDTKKLNQLFDKYMIMDESSELARKICRGITDFDNLKAHFTFEISYNNVEPMRTSGYLSVDAQNEKMYMTGEGTFSWGELKDVTSVVVMNGHDDSAFRITDKATNEDLYFGVYRYANGYASPPPEYHYIYLCKDIEKRLSPRFTYDKSVYSFEKREAGGNTEITVHSKSKDVDYNNFAFKIILNEKGQLISYDFYREEYNVSFKLDDYVFDSPDFTMEDVGPVYESIQAETEANTNKAE